MKVAMIGLRGLGDGLGGIEKAVRELSTRMVKDGHSVTCYCKNPYSQNDLYKGVKLINLATSKGKYLETLIYTMKAIFHASRQNYDIIHIHALASACLAWIPKFLFKKNVVITVHGLDWQRAKWGFIARQILKFGEWASVKFASSTLCVSKSLCLYYQMRYAQNKIFYIPNGCDYNNGNYPEHDCFPKDSYFLYLGRLVPEKGVHNLIKAFNRLRTDKKLIIAGPECDKKYYQSLKREASGNLKIFFTGAVYDEEKIRLLANAYLFVLPSEIEGLPIALLEAGSYGVCTAVSEIPTNNEVIDNSIIPYGFQFKPNNVKELQTVLQQANHSSVLVKSLGKQLQKQVQRKYNWDDICQQSLSAYEAIL